MIFFIVTRTNWIDNEAVDEIKLFGNLREIAKELYHNGIKEIAMPIPIVPSMKGRFRQVAKSVLSAISGRNVHCKLYLPH